MALYNLDRNTESFDFILGGFTWLCRYPSPIEVKELLDLQKIKDTEKSETKLRQKIASMIKCLDANAPKNVFDLETNVVQQNLLVKMVLAEFFGDRDIKDFKDDSKA